jgi:hypothetical protein
MIGKEAQSNLTADDRRAMAMTLSNDRQRRLMFHGMVLFLLGLLVVFAEGQSFGLMPRDY